MNIYLILVMESVADESSEASMRRRVNADREDFDLNEHAGHGDHELPLHPPSLERMLSESDYQCHCCYQLMIEPTTLSCGHNFCRFCLAQWVVTSKKRECPECRQQFPGNPKVNYTLRNIITRSFPVKTEEMLNNMASDPQQQNIINQMEQFLDTSGSLFTKNINIQIGSAFCYGIILTTAVILMLWLFSWLKSPDNNLLVHKPVTRWSSEDVSDWFSDLGGWTEQYIPQLLEREIDGVLLVALTDEYLETYFNMSELHRRAVLNAINSAVTLGVKPPSTLWEYKALYPRNTISLVGGLQSVPRLTMLYLYFYQYTDTFLPFLYAICPSTDEIEEELLSRPHKLPAVTAGQWTSFIPKLIFLPYFMIIEFSWLWFLIHYWTVSLLFVSCAVATYKEAGAVVALKNAHSWQAASFMIIGYLKTYARSVFGQSVLCLLWPVIPWIFCDVYFYYCMFVSPMEEIWKLIKYGYNYVGRQQR